MANTSTQTGTAVSETAATNIWTPNTMATDLMGILNRSPNATGGTPSTRLLRIVTDAYADLWEMHEWQFRKVLATLMTVSGTATVYLPTDFEKLDQDWLNENNDRGVLLFTENQEQFEDWRHVHSDQGGVPTIAFIKVKTSLTTSYLAEVLFTPTPNAVLTYPYFYLRFAPSLAVTASPVWPRVFNRGWKYLATARARKSMESGKAWEGDEALWQDWLANAKVNNNEVKSSNTAVIGDGYGDLGSTASSPYQWGVGGAGAGGSVGGPAVIPWPILWNAVWALDDGGPLATARAQQMIEDTMANGAMGVAVGGDYPDWLNPLIAAGGHKTVVTPTWGSLFIPGEPAYESYEGFPDPDAARYARWLLYMQGKVNDWLPSIFISDQELPYGIKDGMVEAIYAALAAAGLSDTPMYWYRSDEVFGIGVVGEGPSPTYYHEYIPVGTGDSIWTFDDPVAAIQTRLANPTTTVRGGYPWITPWLNPNTDYHYLGLMQNPSAMYNVCRELRAHGALGVIWYDSGIGISGATYEASQVLQRVAASAFR